MVLQILTDFAARMDERDAFLDKEIGRADSGELEELGTLDGAGGEDDFAPCPHFVLAAAANIANTLRPTPFEKNTVCERVRDDVQLRMTTDRPQISHRRAAPKPAPGVEL